MKISRLTVAIGFVSFTLPAVFAQTPSSEMTLTGNPVFQKNCTKCHGKTAEGRTFGGPSLVSDRATATSADELRAVITDGKHHMPKYAGKLTPEQIDILVQQIKSTNKK